MRRAGCIVVEGMKAHRGDCPQVARRSGRWPRGRVRHGAGARRVPVPMRCGTRTDTLTHPSLCDSVMENYQAGGVYFGGDL